MSCVSRIECAALARSLHFAPNSQERVPSQANGCDGCPKSADVVRAPTLKEGCNIVARLDEHHSEQKRAHGEVSGGPSFEEHDGANEPKNGRQGSGEEKEQLERERERRALQDVVIASDVGDVFLCHVCDECDYREQVRDDDAMWVDRSSPGREPPEEESSGKEWHQGDRQYSDQQELEEEPRADEQRDEKDGRDPWGGGRFGTQHSQLPPVAERPRSAAAGAR